MSGDRDLEVLAQGGCLLIATDTVYGLCARPGTSGYQEIFELKQRPAAQVLPWLIPDAASLNLWASDVPVYARKLASFLWPGGLTLVLRASERACALGGVAEDGTIALRVPADERCRSLMRSLGSPLACTSANLHGHPAPVSLEQINPCLAPYRAGRIAPRCPGGTASTIVSCTGTLPIVLREGCIPTSVILDVALATGL